ncbi:MAG: hypothetical protein HDS29_00480 [Bacteroides sp.]|nr:hypothetical protein [Bacteroides sp.]
MPQKRSWARLISKIHDAVTSARGKEILLFLLFLMISYVFWLLLTLNNEMQEDIEVPVEIAGIPDSVTVISNIPESLKISVRDKGSALMKYKLGGIKPMKINWADYSQAKNKFLLNKADLGAKIRDYISSSSQLVTMLPDSISLSYTTTPGRRVAVKVQADLKPIFGSIINGPLTTNTDSVWLFSVEDLPHNLTHVETLPIVRSSLSDTTEITVAIKPLPGVKIVPEEIVVKVPVEPLIARRQMATVIAKNIPDNISLHTFPSRIEIAYLVPMSEYNSEPYDINAYVDYADIANNTSGKLPVTLSLYPESYHSVEAIPDSVEYITEHKVISQ